ncbi:DUF937 domain-containing protein [Deinococcus multiflagellatus]|uniref:DUF937 domain-containing protein n=1 Tax=Deinococcus multiflagellatus TaxID=1656887 RepID=A0ABW1ZHH3_9DEIO|nr:DUF937 domain-containing protein [Deinococcus multiflagellatus]MBZ9714344.1 DUF937 domain-containing protein [Deinococcus multiflagellatus]
MMDILSQLGGLGGAGQTLGRQLGTSPQQTEAAMEAALPLLLGALTRNAAQPGGLDTLGRALDRHDGSALSAFGQGQMPDMTDGQKILGHVFGGQQTQAAQAVGRRAGIDPQLAMQLLTMLAPLVLGYLSRQRQGQGGGGFPGQGGAFPGQGGGADLGSILGGLLGGAGGGLGNILGGMLGGAPAQPMPRQPDPYNQGGSVLGGGPVIPGYPSPASPQGPAQRGGGDLFGTLNRALDRDGDGGALDDLIGMFGGGRR